MTMVTIVQFSMTMVTQYHCHCASQLKVKFQNSRERRVCPMVQCAMWCEAETLAADATTAPTVETLQPVESEKTINFLQVLEHVPSVPHSIALPVGLASLSKIHVVNEKFNAITMKHLCLCIEGHLFATAYSSDSSSKVYTACAVSIGASAPCVKGQALATGSKLFLAGSISCTPSTNCFPICVGASNAFALRP